MAKKINLTKSKRQQTRRDKITASIKGVSKITLVKTIGLTRMEYRFEKIEGREVLREIAFIPRKNATIKSHTIKK